MKKAVKWTAVAVLAVLLLTGVWAAGRREGIRHTIEDSELWVLEQNEGDGYDFDVEIELDDNWYIHKCFIG